ncbi:acetyl-CoA carboxylase biotin carboxyl carrier protein [Micromonospora sp. AP08]|uniref:acetyl-CoA carboxylase biotin carboxyl carrier protein n=1 Tax=Micromonospora sp. AP08 TaxID=2604467 RepID=UPI0011DB02C9|nr:acetyl-CoA carboxylase biotin carboxyl carrier protein [Micromonospora sp. AP08]TYB39221.1 acetyl-CoA carboxylase biotin carboxyl carrier protein [Micromonospora sp. AP08]
MTTDHSPGSVAAVPGDRTADDVEMLQEVSRTVAGLLRQAHQPPRRVAATVGTISIEMEWPAVAAGALPANGAAPPAPVVNGVAAPATTLNGTVAEPPPVHLDGAVRSPLVGTFYRAPEVGAAPFVSVGDVVEPGQQVGIVEAMKLMNPVEVDRRGRVVEILVADAEPVEYDQPLIVLGPVDGER